MEDENRGLKQDLPVSAVPKEYQDALLTTPRLRREQRTIEAMLHIWCEAHPLNVRSRSGELCAKCKGLFDYANYRLFKCPYGEEKPTCTRSCASRGPVCSSAIPSSRSGTSSTRRRSRRPCRASGRKLADLCRIDDLDAPSHAHGGGALSDVRLERRARVVGLPRRD